MGRNYQREAWKEMTKQEQEARAKTSHKDDPLLTFRQAADELGVHHSTISTWCDTKRMAYCTLPGGIKRIRMSTVIAVRHEIESCPPPEHISDTK